jgi:hypothetical protein
MKHITCLVLAFSLSAPLLADSMYDSSDSSFGTFSPQKEEEQGDTLQADEMNEPAEYSDWSHDQLMLERERQRQDSEDEMYEDFQPQDEVDSYSEGIDTYPTE